MSNWFEPQTPVDPNIETGGILIWPSIFQDNSLRFYFSINAFLIDWIRVWINRYTLSNLITTSDTMLLFLSIYLKSKICFTWWDWIVTGVVFYKNLRNEVSPATCQLKIFYLFFIIMKKNQSSPEGFIIIINWKSAVPHGVKHFWFKKLWSIPQKQYELMIDKFISNLQKFLKPKNQTEHCVTAQWLWHFAIHTND